jgi:hypothetical protein
MRRAVQTPRRRHIAWIASVACAVAAALAVAPATNAQQGSAQDQYKLDLPSATSSQQPRQPTNLSPAAAHRLADPGADHTGGVIVWVLAVGLAAISCAGAAVAYRRRQLADQAP